MSDQQLQEVAHVLREYYDNRGSNLEHYARRVLDLRQVQKDDRPSRLRKITSADDLNVGYYYLVVVSSGNNKGTVSGKLRSYDAEALSKKIKSLTLVTLTSGESRIEMGSNNLIEDIYQIGV